jgi:hypothetical protein
VGGATRKTTSGLDVIQDVFLAFQAGDDDGASGVDENGERGAGHVEKAVEYQQHADAFGREAAGMPAMPIEVMSASVTTVNCAPILMRGDGRPKSSRRVQLAVMKRTHK